MRNKIIVIAVLAALVSSGTQVSAASADRVEEVTYKRPAQGIYTPYVWAWMFDCFEGDGCVILYMRSRERFLDIDIRDATGQPVYAQLRDPSSQEDVVAHIYGSTEEPLRLRPSVYTLHIVPGVSPDLQPSAPTTGTVVATYSRR